MLESSSSTSTQTTDEEKAQKLHNLNTTSFESVINKAGHGYSYRLKLQMFLLLIAGGNKDFENFKLTSEVKLGKKFKAIVLQYKIQGKRNIIFLQPRHAQADKPILQPYLLFTPNNEQFFLIDYFMSYKNKVADYSTIADLKFVICTNRNLKSKSSKNGEEIIYKPKDSKEMSIFLQKIEPEELTDQKIDRKDFKLINDYSGRFYHIKPTKGVIDLLISKLIKQEKITNKKDEIKKEKEAIKDFLNNLILAVDQPNDEALDDIIVEFLRKKFEWSEEIATLAKFSYQGMMYKWMNEKNSEPLTKFELDDFMKNTKTKILVSQFLWITKYLIAELESKSLTFENSRKLQEINKFLGSKKKILILTTPSSLTALGSIFVLQGIKDLNFKQGHFLFMKISSFNNFKDDFLQCITDDSIKFLVLEVDCDVNFLEIGKTISQARKAPATILKFIFIASGTFEHVLHPKIELSDGSSIFSMLTKPSQDKLLQKIVKFQGEHSKLDDVDNDLLFKLINNHEIAIGVAIKNNNVIKMEFKEEIRSDMKTEK